MIVSLNPINRQNRAPLVTLDHGYSIIGTVKRKNTSYQASVQLYERATGILIDQKLSDASGNYRFSNLSNNYKYLLIAKDPQRIFNAVIKDMVVPK